MPELSWENGDVDAVSFGGYFSNAEDESLWAFPYGFGDEAMGPDPDVRHLYIIRGFRSFTKAANPAIDWASVEDFSQCHETADPITLIASVGEYYGWTNLEAYMDGVESRPIARAEANTLFEPRDGEFRAAKVVA